MHLACLSRSFFLAALLFSLSAANLVAGQSQGPKAADLVQDGQLINLQEPKYKALFQELEQQHHFRPEELRQIFHGQKISKKVLELMDRPWEAKPYYKYFPLFLTPQNIQTGKEKLWQYREVLDRVEQQFGVDREFIVAIWGVETRYGTNQGDFKVLPTLNTLFDAYPKRSDFFREQLVHFLLLCKENGIDPQTIKGSYAGAFGQTQFIPSSFRAFAVSFDGNQQKDVWNSVPDVLASIANYIKKHGWVLNAPVYAELGSKLQNGRLTEAMDKGWKKGRVPWQLVREMQQANLPPSPGNRPLSIVGLELDPQQSPQAFRYIAGYPNFQAITEWNHSNRYAMAVVELAEKLAKP
ncbi:lytic murein transglycosylase [Candidatus Electronema sp. PJ]|uniref:lytic murein transglycosylase n=1 Tax=Candidatus Electronema sp. PJ TaxID=3401572 RepID=UPI003AA99A0E